MIEERAALYGAATPAQLAEETYENYKRYVNPPLARVMKLSGTPVEVRAHGSTIWDQNGKAYLDFAGGYGVFTLGHSHPRVVEAVRAQLELMALSGKTMFNVCSDAPRSGSRSSRPEICRSRSGATAEPKRSKARSSSRARRPGAPRSSATHDAYHGKTLGALSVSGRETFQTPFAPLLADSSTSPFGERDALEDGARTMPPHSSSSPCKARAASTCRRPAICARRARRAIARERCFVADEVQTGLGRCGYRFACESRRRRSRRDDAGEGTLRRRHSGRRVHRACADLWNRAFGKAPLLHTSTFGGSEIACAAAIAAMDVLEEERSRRERSRARRAAAATARARSPPSIRRSCAKCAASDCSSASS